MNQSYLGTPFDLTGKVALVSGGAGLLGTEFCKALAGAGAKIVVADRNEKLLQAASIEILKKVPKAQIVTQVLDVCAEDSIRKCVDQVCQKWNTVDILVNSAALDPKFEKNTDTKNYTLFPNYPRLLWEQSISVNLTGAFLLTQAVCAVMEKQNSGSVVFLGSNYGLVGPDQRIYKKKGEKSQAFKPAVYSVCKAGLLGFTKYLAAYYAGTKIRVNMLTPSGVFSNHEKEFEKNYALRTVLRRMSQKNEYAGAVIFLASEASSYMTGANLVIDGGWTAL